MGMEIEAGHPASAWACLCAPALLLLGAACYAAGEPPTGCETCHGDRKYFVQHRKIYQYYQDWLTSPHKRGGVDCDDCHGGDPEAADAADAHRGILPVSNPGSGLYYKKQPETCGECHKKQAKQFKESSHYKGLREQLGTPTCTTCHSAMNRKPYFRDMVQQTCRVCHYENNKDDLPLVADKANEILHRLNISKGYMNWTRVYYQSKGWPGESRALVDSLADEYDAIITYGHTFDLKNTDKASIDLLSRLKATYRRVKQEVQEEEE